MLCFVVVAASAKSVVFTLSDGTLVYYLLGGESNPMLHFKDGKVVVNADTYEFSDIKNFYISATDDPNSIEQVLSRENVTFRDNVVVIASSDVKSVRVCSVGGGDVKAEVVKHADVITVSLKNLPKGIYVISAGASSIKVNKK